MDSHQVLFGIAAVNLMLVATTWTGSRAGRSPGRPQGHPGQSIKLVDARGEVRHVHCRATDLT